MSLEFEFDTKTQQYRYKDSGKFLGRQAMKTLTQKAINQTEDQLTKIADSLVDRTITLADWEAQTQNKLRQLHTWQYHLGIGGQKNFTPQDQAVLNDRLIQEFGYLRNFANAINDGNLSEAQFRYRLNLYVNNTDNTYELAFYKGHIRNGYKWERRIRSKTESCTECLFYESLGWRTIGNLPNPGSQCSCQANCGCYKEFSKADFIPADAGFANALLTGHGWGVVA
jgi:hypothetical protein